MPLVAKVSVLPSLWGIKLYQATFVLGCEVQKYYAASPETNSILSGNWNTFKIGLKHAILPSITLGIFYSSYFGRTIRNVLGNALNSNQVEFAKALGLSKFRVFLYALVDARTPIITYIAILFASLFGACAIIETVFSWNGIGSWAIDRILMLDIPAIQGFILCAGLITLFTYTFLDIIITFIDPRIRKESI